MKATLLTAVLTVAMVAACAVELIAAPSKRPNIVLIMADDLGYSDLGCYGSRIETPNIDLISSQGVRLSNFRVNPMCVVTRTSLLTGHEHSQSDSYRRSLPLPKALAAAGYRTSISGKWHQPGHPMDHGFDQFYGFLGGAINNFTGSNAIRRQREPEQVPADWFATDAFTTHTIKCIDSAIEEDKPFFAFLAFNAPHTPLNVRKPLVEKYAGRFDAGWEVLREQRFQRLRELGLIDDRYQQSLSNADVRPWEDLTAETQEFEAFRMQTYAAVVDNLDTNVGRLMKFLAEKNVAENTIVIFCSDNGGDYSNGDIARDKSVIPWERESHPFMSNGWAYLKCTPFRYYKTSAYEGGVRVPMIIRWPAGLKHQPGKILHHQTHVTDLYPTCLDLADTSYTPNEAQAPLQGKSLLPLLESPALPTAETQHPVFWALEDTTRGYLDYPWKIVSINEGPWQLFDVKIDPCEITNLANEYPEKVESLGQIWKRFAREETTMAPDWRKPLRLEQHGWGFHRLTRIWSFVTSTPLCSQSDVPIDTSLSFTFERPLDFSRTKHKTVRLYRVQDPSTPVWTCDPESDHPGQGQTTVAFDNLPTLKPDTAYFVLADNGWAKVGKKPLQGLNDGAYWFRFRTKKD